MQFPSAPSAQVLVCLTAALTWFLMTKTPTTDSVLNMNAMAERPFPLTFEEFLEWLLTEYAYLHFLEWMRWPMGFLCPQCVVANGWCPDRVLWPCQGCFHQASATAGAVFEDSIDPLQLWFHVMRLMMAHKTGLVLVAVAGAVKKILGSIHFWCVENIAQTNIDNFACGYIESCANFNTYDILVYSNMVTISYKHFPDFSTSHGESAPRRLDHATLVILLLKRWPRSHHQGVFTLCHLQASLEEFFFRFNHRLSQHLGKLFYMSLEQAVSRGHRPSYRSTFNHAYPVDAPAAIGCDAHLTRYTTHGVRPDVLHGLVRQPDRHAFNIHNINWLYDSFSHPVYHIHKPFREYTAELTLNVIFVYTSICRFVFLSVSDLARTLADYPVAFIEYSCLFIWTVTVGVIVNKSACACYNLVAFIAHCTQAPQRVATAIIYILLYVCDTIPGSHAISVVADFQCAHCSLSSALILCQRILLHPWTISQAVVAISVNYATISPISAHHFHPALCKHGISHANRAYPCVTLQCNISADILARRPLFKHKEPYFS